MEKKLSRKRLLSQHQRNINKIEALGAANLQIRRQLATLTDKHYKYIITEEEVGRGKNKTKKMIGRQHWKQKFQDEDTGEWFTINRATIVTVDGEWV